MQREREGRRDLFDMGEPFRTFQGFGGFGAHMSSLFGGRDPFDDPFFTRPFGSMFGPGAFGTDAPSVDVHQTDRERGVLIEELNSDDGGEKEDRVYENNEDGFPKRAISSKEPSIEYPEDDADGERKIQKLNQRGDYNRVQGTQLHVRNFGVQTCKVTYGGVDGAYYTSTRTRRMGSDGAVLEESKEADRTTGQATHRISRGIHDKGHSVTRKLNSDGKVDTTQTLHNLNEDELVGFEEAWKGNAQGSGSGAQARGKDWMLPFREQARNAGGQAGNEARTYPSEGRTKKVVRINIE